MSWVVMHSANADNIPWNNAATDNIGWHTAENWAGGVLPGSKANDRVILADSSDTPYISLPDMTIANPVEIVIREEATLTIREDLPNINTVFMGSSPGLGGGHVIHSSGLFEPDLLIVGGSFLATSNSSYVIEGNGELATSGDLSVTTGELTVEGEEAIVDVGGDLNLFRGGDLKFVFGQLGLQPIVTPNEFRINSSDSVLTVDTSFYIGGTQSFELVKFGSRSGSFSASKIIFEGLRANQAASISYGPESMSVTITTNPVSGPENGLRFSIAPLAGTSDAIARDITLNNGSNISQLGLSNGQTLSGSNNLQCTRSTDGNDLIYSVIWLGRDYDGDSVNDTFSFDVRVKAYSGGNYTYSATSGESSISALGEGAKVSEENGRWGVGSDIDLDAGESLGFTIENINVSAAGFVGEVNGFDSFGLNETGGNSHTHIRGEGVGSGLNSGRINFPVDYNFPLLKPLIITSAGSASARGFQIDHLTFRAQVYNPNVTNGTSTLDVSDYSSTPDGATFVEPYPAQTGNVSFPDFSWNKTPRWLAVRNRDQYSQGQIDSITNNYQLVMMEKSNQNGLERTQEGMSRFAASLKATSPNIKTIAYWNTSLLYQDFEASDSFDDDNWSETLVDEDGAVTFRLQRNLLLRHNRELPEVRDWWVNTALDLAEDPNIDGLFIDLASTSNPYFYDSFGEPTDANAKMFDAVRKGMPATKMLVGNALSNEHINGNRQVMEVFDGSYLERWDFPSRNSLFNATEADSIVNSIQMMREALSLGKLINIQSPPSGLGIENDPIPGGSANFDARRAHASKWVDFPLAVFLIAANENAYFGYNVGVNAIEQGFNDDIWDTSFVDQFNRPLGPPLADPIRKGYVFTRSYTNADVWVDVEKRKANIFWKNDIGNPALPGSAVSNDDIYTLQGSGNLNGTEDNFFFFSDLHDGGGGIQARIDTLSAPGSSAKAGIMFRERNEPVTTTFANLPNEYTAAYNNGTVIQPDARTVAVVRDKNGSLHMIYRSETGGEMAVTGNANAPFGLYAKLVRIGDRFIGYSSPNGEVWTQLGQVTLKDMSDKTEMGMAIASSDENKPELATATFSEISRIDFISSTNEVIISEFSAPEVNGIPISFLENNGLEVTGAVSLEDPDADGLTNIEEYLRGTDPLTTNSPADYENWANNLVISNIGLPSDDYDGDGQSNNTERIWGLDPASSSSNNPYTRLLDKSGVFQYTRRNTDLSGISYSIWTSTDLINWNESTDAAERTLSAENSVVETVEITLGSDDIGLDRLFVRVQALEAHELLVED